MNELKVFENEQFGKVRVVEVNGEGWLVGKDIAEALGYENQNRDIVTHVDEEDRIMLDKTQYENGIEFDYKQLGQRGGWIINESGMYSLVMSSKLQNAKKFRRWITSEVLPTIRKTGGYVSNDEQFINTYLPFADDTTKMLFKSTLETVRKQNELIQQQKETIEQQEVKIEVMRPSVDMAQKRRASDGLYTYTDCQKKYGLKQGQIGCYLKIKGFVHWDKKETTKLGDDMKLVKQYGEEFPNIGITELGLKYLEDNLDELKKTPCKLPKKKQDWLDMQ